MIRYTVRMFADQWRQWTPAIGVIATISALVGLCVNQYSWTREPAFESAVLAVQTSTAEFRILSLTIYAVIAGTAWASLIIVGRSTVEATARTHALWLLLGASPAAVFRAVIGLLFVVALCGSLIGTAISSAVSFWALPAFNSSVAPRADLPPFALVPWAPAAAVGLSCVTAVFGGLSTAVHAARTAPGVALGRTDAMPRRSLAAVLRVVSGLVLGALSAALVTASGFAEQLGVAGPGPMFNLALNAGVCSLAAVCLLCPEGVRLVFWLLTATLRGFGAHTLRLGVRAAADRVRRSSTTVAPLAAGLGAAGLLLCAVLSAGALTSALRPETRTDLSDSWTVVAVVAICMFATSGAVTALSARDRSEEVSLLQSLGLDASHVRKLIAAEAFAMTLAATVLAAVPIAAVGLVSTFVSTTLLGHSTTVWPLIPMAAGFGLTWALLAGVLAIPAASSFARGTGRIALNSQR